MPRASSKAALPGATPERPAPTSRSITTLSAALAAEAASEIATACSKSSTATRSSTLRANSTSRANFLPADDFVGQHNIGKPVLCQRLRLAQGRTGDSRSPARLHLVPRKFRAAMVLELRPKPAEPVAEEISHPADVSIGDGAIEQQCGRDEILDGPSDHLAIHRMAG